jgi:SNF2 family DNA or RNA helicase
MEQGTGKSKVTIDKITYLYQQGAIDSAIIISPNAVALQWVNEQFPTHFPYEDWNGLLWQGAKTKREKNKFEKYLNDKRFFLYSCNVEAFQHNNIPLFVNMMIRNRKTIIIVDESTRIKNGRRKPKRGKRAGAKRTNTILDLFEDVQHKGILTGTPTPNSPFDLWAQFEFLHKNFFDMDYFYFEHHHGIMLTTQNRDGKSYKTIMKEDVYAKAKRRLDKMETLDEKSLDELHVRSGVKIKDLLLIRRMDKYRPYKNMLQLKKKIAPVTVFIKKKDCLDLPPKVHEKLYCHMDKEQKAIYEKLKKEMMVEYAGEELAVTIKVVLYLRLQMITGGLFPFAKTDIKVGEDGEPVFNTYFDYKPIGSNAKLKVLLEDLEEVSVETSIIIWARFVGEVNIIADALVNAGHKVGKYYADASIDVIDQFKKREIRFLVATEKGAEGLNLQISTLHYFYSTSYRYDKHEQQQDRSHRIGQKNKVTYKYLICIDTLDVRVYEVLNRKQSLVQYFRSNPFTL